MLNTLIRGYEITTLAGKGTVEFFAGEFISIQTPGGVGTELGTCI